MILLIFLEIIFLTITKKLNKPDFTQMSAKRNNSIARTQQRKFDFLGHSAPAR